VLFENSIQVSLKNFQGIIISSLEENVAMMNGHERSYLGSQTGVA
jgi:hypothetical protein